MNTTHPIERIPRAEAMRLALLDTLNLEGLALHPEDRAVLNAWARHELTSPQAIDQLHRLLDELATTLTPKERQTRARASFPTLRLAELQCYGLDPLPPPLTPRCLAMIFPPLTPEERKVYTEEQIPEDYEGFLIPIPLNFSQAQINQLPDYCFRSATHRVVRMPPSFFNLRPLPPNAEDS